jgi:3-oxoacyl-[acyl-carrier-protein] synthase III
LLHLLWSKKTIMLQADQFAIAFTERSPVPYAGLSQTVGISAIATYEPPWVLDNGWFEGTLSRKFVQHTGILSRRISLEDEVTMGIRAVESLQDQSRCEMRDCVAVVFASSSLVHGYFARRYLCEEQARREDFQVVAREFVDRLGIPSARVFGINWGCSGYSRAMEIAARYAARSPRLRREQFILVVTVNRTSKITDYGCKVTAPIFGDFAQATLLGGADSHRYPMELALVYAAAERQPADGAFFNYHLRENVIVPTPEGGRAVEPRRLVFSLDMMGLGDGAPRAMANAAAKALQSTGIQPYEVDFVVPHQAGTGVIRLTAMKLEELGIGGEVINGLTQNVGNISSSSVPYALQQNWDRLQGTVVCPTAAVGMPGHASLTQGCIILKATRSATDKNDRANRDR